MTDTRHVFFEDPALLEFKGPDAIRFLNGQLTQDVRRVADGTAALPSCVTDAKGKLQFHITITANTDGALWVVGPPGTASDLEARLTRYLIADDVEVTDLTGQFSLIHLIGTPPSTPAGVMARTCNRFGMPGTDWWIQKDTEIELPGDSSLLEGDELETLRIAQGIPAWGKELKEGILPPEAGLDATDISYQKGCYIGQEVISRIKSAGKVNKRLMRMEFDASLPVDALELVDSEGATAGEITSISPLADPDRRLALGYVKRGISEVFAKTPDGILAPIVLL